jgi:hypothetical protein
MRRQAWVLVASLSLALGIALLRTNHGRSDDDEEEAKVRKEAGEAIAKLLEALDKPGGAKKEAATIKAKFPELKPLMEAAFKPAKGNIPFEPGVETWIIKWDHPRSRSLTAADIAKLKEVLECVAKVSRSMAYVTDEYVRKRGAANWMRFSAAMRMAAEDLSKGTKAADATAVRKAITNLHASCTSCHGDFRDEP